jgi:phage portal protein BeeE
MLADLEKSSFSTSSSKSLEFVKYTLDPWVVRWEQTMCRSLLMESEKPKYLLNLMLMVYFAVIMQVV